MDIAIHLPDDIAQGLPWEDIPRHLLEQTPWTISERAFSESRYGACWDMRHGWKSTVPQSP